SVDYAAFGTPVLALAREVLDEFSASRRREGEKLAEMIVDRVNAIRAIVRRVEPRIPEAQALYTDKLRQRLTEALGGASDERVLQEVAVFATRIDVAEELTRLNAHLDEVERVLKQGGACGKRLDFLMQELNREANTLGSKSAITEVSQASMDLKLLIEQMREQIQNLE
ncbi:MAG TPA: YicC/YloC family endoribonuclease, partial [Azonexus sp.]